MGSGILVGVLIALRSEGLVALPIQDAVLVADDHKDKTITIMKKVFKEHTGDNLSGVPKVASTRSS